MNMPYSYLVIGAARWAPSMVTVTGVAAQVMVAVAIDPARHAPSINPYRIVFSLITQSFLNYAPTRHAGFSASVFIEFSV